VYCKPDGTFEARGLTGGNYYVSAYRHLDFENLRHPEVIQQIVREGTKVSVSRERPIADLKLQIIPLQTD
jgi:hypothetical protein